MTILKKSISVFATAAIATFLFTATTGCDEEPDILIVKEGETPNADSLVAVFDNFEINKLLSDSAISDENYTNQTTLGYQCGGVANPDHDSLDWGGSFWYAFASDDGAKVLGFNEDGTTFEVVDSLGESSPNGDVGNALMSKLLGDSTMTFDLNCTNVADNEYWAGVGVSLAGDPEHLTGVSGVTEVTVFNGDKDETLLTWDLSDLVSISIKGNIQGSANFTLTGARGTGSSPDTSGTALVVIESDNSDGGKDFDTTIEMSSFKANSEWMGGTWEEIKDAVAALSFELNTGSTTMGTQAIIKLNYIKFNFNTVADKEKAFPFLAE